MVSHRTLILECGPDRVSLAVFSRPGARLCLHELAVETLPVAGEQNRDARWLENTGTALRSLRRRIKKRGPVTLLLPARLCLTKFIKLPKVEVAQLEKILRFEAAQNIPYALEEVVWGSIAVNETETESEALLAAARRDSLEALCSAVQLAGFEPRIVLPATLATLSGFRLISGPGAGSFLGVNLGAQSTTLVLIEKSGRFALRTFALGLDENVTRATERPKSPPPAETREPFSTRLLQEISRSLLHFQWRNGMGKPDGVCLSGIPAGLSGLSEVLEGKLQAPVRLADFRAVVDLQKNSTNSGAEDRGAALVDSIGAAAANFEPKQPAINLLPPLLGERAGSRARRPWLVVAAVLAAMILIPPLVHFRSLRDEALNKNHAIERELAPVRAWDRRNQENLRLLAGMNQDLSLYRDTIARRRSWLRLMSGLQERLGRVEDVWLDKLQLAPAIPGEPMKLLVSGRMLDRA
ncbi:MAG TPA: pilus assembly protein PilM, partial [Verrucomicrobiae bacterium]|nr:pilus assembly protein PilM [Verrucomicrobiae bacterium]